MQRSARVALEGLLATLATTCLLERMVAVADQPEVSITSGTQRVILEEAKSFSLDR